MFETIKNIFSRRAVIHDLRDTSYVGYQLRSDLYGNVIFRNIYGLLTNLINDVTFTSADNKIEMFTRFNIFVQTYGQQVLNALYENGFVVIGFDGVIFRPLRATEYHINKNSDGIEFISKLPNVKIYPLLSDIFEEKQISYAQHLRAYIKFIDNVLNSSATLTERLGTLIIGSPKNLTNAPTETILPKSEKEQLEKDLASDYGSLRGQKQIMLLPREMAWQTINLSGFDNHTNDKLRTAVTIIADCLQVPSNQISLIDTFNTNAFANGSELREGDFLKYATFERLLNSTFVKLATNIGIKVNYTIYNKPTRTI